MPRRVAHGRIFLTMPPPICLSLRPPLESIQHQGDVLRMTDINVMQPPIPVQAERPLCVDLDGTLVKSDTLLDSLMVLARRDPAAFLRSPLWAVKGKAHLKSQVTSLVALDVAHLPYNRPLLTYLREEHAAGRKLYLATGAIAPWPRASPLTWAFSTA